MEKSKTYENVRFSSDTIRDALKVFTDGLPRFRKLHTTMRRIHRDEETWNFDSDEEFFAAFRKPCSSASLHKFTITGKDAKFDFGYFGRNSDVSVEQHHVAGIEEVFDVFEKKLEDSRLPIPRQSAPLRDPVTVFIGHGGNKQWRELKDHLTDKHGYNVSAYEVGARAGHTIRDILQELLENSTFALLVMTAEDEAGSGEKRARQNVIHELGLFQGKLGFPRAIAIVESGTELLSNIDGVQQLRFSPGNIAEVYGDVIATLRREFGDAR